MQPLRTYSVVPRLPRPLEGLWELAYNFWFAWNGEIESLFSQMDGRLWEEVEKNPVRFLGRLPQALLETLTRDEIFLERLREALESQRHYLARKESLVELPGADEGQPAVAYFSLEYGLALSLPIYSGGLGILAGDHLKSSSDLNLPLVGIGLLYQQGYFRQYLTPDGWQQERYHQNDFEQMPLNLALDENGEPVRISLELQDQTMWAQVWAARVGRVTLYLLDTNIPENPPHFQQVTARLYGGGLEMRIWQEMLIGIGGIKALRALGLAPKVIHMNEGHSAFAGLERIRLFMTEHNLPFEAAMELVASSSVFTTHTPVPAGNDRFPPDMMHRYFEPYARDMGLAFKVLLALGREDPRDDAEPFCMTVLALRLSRFNNGVSTLHGFVSRNMWKRVWPSYPVDDVPIGSITNGVHVPTWVARDMAQLYDRYLGPNWREDPDCTHAWGKAEDISDNELWRTHERLRARLVDFVRARLKRQMQAKGARRRALEIAEEALDPTALTIGFARRFATYKRAGLLLRDKERLRRLLTDEKRPVQLLIAGKAHPADNEGKKLIQELIQFCRAEDVRHRMIFLEDYDIRLAQAMLQGCDIWLNVPRRPLEACGTSGMKALVNGVLNLSIPDGWWDEAWRPDTSVGWAIGRGEEYDDHEYQDFVESQTLFNLLENEVVPDFYERSHGNLPRAWVRRMKRAISDLVPRYNSHRMVEDYVATAYVPAVENYNRLIRDDFMPSKEMASWRMEMMTRWSSLAVRDIRAQAEEKLHVGEPVEVGCQVHLGGIRPQDVKVELYAGPLDNQGQFASRHTAPMQAGEALEDGWHAFTGHIQPRDSGRFGFTVRIVPNHPLLLDPRSLGLIHWAQE